MGVSYDQNSPAEHEHPNRHVLDRVSETIPVIAVHASSHMVVANTKLLELAGIAAETPDPEGARYGREADSTPDGYCEEPGAMWPVFAVIQPRQKMDMDVMIGEMQDIYLENGITTCREGATTADFAALFCGLANKGLLKMDVVSYPHVRRGMSTKSWPTTSLLSRRTTPVTSVSAGSRCSLTVLPRVVRRG